MHIAVQEFLRHATVVPDTLILESHTHCYSGVSRDMKQYPYLIRAPRASLAVPLAEPAPLVLLAPDKRSVDMCRIRRRNQVKINGGWRMVIERVRPSNSKDERVGHRGGKHAFAEESMEVPSRRYNFGRAQRQHLHNDEVKPLLPPSLSACVLPCLSLDEAFLVSPSRPWSLVRAEKEKREN